MDRKLHARHLLASLALKLLVWHHVTTTSTSLSSSSEYDPFLATDVPTATTTSYYSVPLQSPDLDSSSDYLAGLTSASYSQPPQTSSSIMMTATTTTSVQITTTPAGPGPTITTLPIITTLPPGGGGPAVTTTTPTPSVNTTDSNCQQGAGSCFMTANQLGARGCNLQSSSVTILLLVALVSCVGHVYYP